MTILTPRYVGKWMDTMARVEEKKASKKQALKNTTNAKMVSDEKEE